MKFSDLHPSSIARSLTDLIGRRSAKSEPDFIYIVENAPWAIMEVGRGIIGQLEKIAPDRNYDVAISCEDARDSHVHFGSIWCLAAQKKFLHASNRYSVSVMHGHPELFPEMRGAFDALMQSINQISTVLVTCCIMEERMLELGIPKDKIRKVPLGINLENFRPPTPEERLRVRRRIGIDDNMLCVGSFQKDGNGWDEGLEPKLIKGPDLLVETMEELAKDNDIFVLLAGPARGYVKQKLSETGLPFHHEYKDELKDLVELYHALDLYIVASREEGGPMAMMESMATGVPLVSTHVGMSADHIVNGENGFVCPIDDVASLTASAHQVLNNPELASRMREGGLATARQFGQPETSLKFAQQLGLTR